MKYPIGIQTFEQIITDGYTYVDKTALIYSLVSEGKVYFLSRPRRFGKSLLISTLENYFLGRKELFEGLAISKLEKDWKARPVFHLDFNSSDFTKSGTLQNALEACVSGWEKMYDVTKDGLLGIGPRFAKVLEAAHRQTGLRAAVLIDEYDKPLLDVMGLPDKVERNHVMVSLEDCNRDILKSFYSTFKAADADLQFVFLTGVTKFSQLSVFSGFNQPEDISLSPQFQTLCGITDEEMEEVFHDSIKEMAEENDYSYEEMKSVLKQKYDGYHFSKKLKGVYNPFSLLNAFKSRDVQDFWFKTGTPTYLVRLLEQSDENLDQFTGKYFAQDEFDDYRADSQQPLPMIFQSGYLTIKDFNRNMHTFMLDFPNDEVKNGFSTLVANNYLKTREGTGSWVRNLVISLKECDLDRFRVLLTSFLASIPYTVRRKENEKERERYFTYTLYLMFRIASCYITYAEKEQSYGRLDCVVETGTDVFIFEFKLDGSAVEALKQINDRGYASEYLSSDKRLHKIGISISSETGTLEDWKVEED